MNTTEVESDVSTRAIQPRAPMPSAPAAAPEPAPIAKSAAAAPPAEATTLESVVVQSGRVQSTAQDAALPVEVISSQDLERSDNTTRKSADSRESRLREEQPGTQELQEIIVTGQFVNSPSRSGAGPRATVRSSSSGANEPSDEEIAKQEREANPEQWLRHIRQLRAEGKRREADREWRAFADAFPNYEVAAADAARPR